MILNYKIKNKESKESFPVLQYNENNKHEMINFMSTDTERTNEEIKDGKYFYVDRMGFHIKMENNYTRILDHEMFVIKHETKSKDKFIFTPFSKENFYNFFEPVFIKAQNEYLNLISILSKQIVSIIFQKKDGTIRKIKATTNTKLIPEEKLRKDYKSDKNGEQTEIKTITFFDTESNLWKSCVADSLIKYEIIK